MSKALAHEIASDYQRVAAELGRAPSRDEYLISGAFSKHTIVSTFGGWTQFLQASGLQYNHGRRDKQEIRKEIHEHLVKEVESVRTRVPEPPQLARNLLIIPDMHFPYQHPDAVWFLRAIEEKYRFDRVVCTGDEIDSHAMSFHDHDADLPSAGHELEAAIRGLEPLYKLFPKMDIAESNHGSLFVRKAKHHGFPINVLKPYSEILRAPPGWNWRFEIKVQLSNGKNVLIHHAYSSNVLNASRHRGMSCIFGHHHAQQSIQYWKNYDDWFFAAFAGSLVDETSLAMAYGRNVVHRPLLGAMRVSDGIPHIIPMITHNGRWTGIVP